MKTDVQHEVGLARVQNWLAVRLAKAGYPDEARRARGMRKFHMEEAGICKRVRFD